MANIKRKLSVLICCLLFAACVVSLAEGESAVMPDSGVYTGIATTIAIPKEITVTNIDPNVTKVYGPSVTYAFSIQPASVSDGTKITDVHDASINVQAGKTEALTSTSANVAIPSSVIELTGGKGTVSGNAEFSFSPANFGAPGVYRYIVQDTTEPATLRNAGIIRAGEYRNTYYLDVYVAYKADADKVAANLEIQGYTFFETNGNITASTSKLSEFEANNNPGDVTLSGTPVSPRGDLYPTFNAYVTTKVTGNMADATNAFPVSLTVNNNEIHFFTTQGELTTASNLEDVTPTSCSTTLKHNEVFHIVGLNVLAKIATEEKNNTSDTYLITIKNKNNADLKAEAATASKATAAHDQLALTDWPAESADAFLTTVTLTENNTGITYINKLNSVSPTGIVRHIAPYVMIMGFAFFFAVLIRRRREEATEE